MSLRERFDEELKAAMRGGDQLRRDVIRLLRSEIHNEEIARKDVLDEDGIVAVLSRQAQQRRDSIEAFAGANRHDLVEKEEAELGIILEYLPEQMSAEEIATLARRVVDETGAAGPQDMGKVMGRIMPQVRGKAEGRAVSAAVSEVLKELAE
jgi:uncharacterized protein YqeY